jgi:hypothetical protein
LTEGGEGRFRLGAWGAFGLLICGGEGSDDPVCPAGDCGTCGSCGRGDDDDEELAGADEG